MHDLKQQLASLKRSACQLKVARDYAISAQQQAEQSKSNIRKKLKKVERELRDLKQVKEDPLTDDEVKHLGLSRRSVLDKNWHGKFPLASRCLLNFDTLLECLLYACTLFPELKPEIESLEKLGAKTYASKKKNLSKLEGCILCRVPKTWTGRFRNWSNLWIIIPKLVTCGCQ